MGKGKPSKGSFFVTGGAVRPDAPSYVERQCDLDLLRELHDGQFCYVLTSRQMGKSSLVGHMASKLRKEGVSVVIWDLTAIGQNLTPEQWYDGLCVHMGVQLQREDVLEEFWNSHRNLGPCQRLFTAIRELVLPELNPVVIFVDEIDMVRSLPFRTDEFFAAVRECYNRRSFDPALENMTFCLLGVATPSDLIKDMRMTPFNIGQRIELSDFTDEEAAPLARGLQTAAIGEKEARSLLKRILYWTDGHPYLTQRLCRAVAEEEDEADGKFRSIKSCIDPQCGKLFFSHRARERDDNLIFVRERLLRTEEDQGRLLNLYKDVLRGKRVRDEETNALVSALRLSGIVQQVRGRLVPRNRIYKRTFDRTWVRDHLPEATLQSERDAFFQGALRVAAIAAVIIGIMVYMVVSMIRDSHKAELSSAQAFVAEAQATLVSAQQGQRFKSLTAITNAVLNYTNQPALRDLAVRALALPDLSLMKSWPGWPSGTTCATISEDFLFYAHGNYQGRVTVCQKTSNRVMAVWPGGGLPIEKLVFSPDHTFLAILSRLGRTNHLAVWSWRDNRTLLSESSAINKSALAFSPDSHRIAVGMSDGTIMVHSLDQGEAEALTLITKPARPAVQLSFHPSEPLLAACSDRSLKVRIFNLHSRQVTNTLFYATPVISLDWHPQGKILAAGCRDGDICLWYYPPAPTPWKILRGFKSEITVLAFNHSGRLLAAQSADKTLRLWVPEVERKMTHYLQREEVQSLIFHEDNECLGVWVDNSKLQCLKIEPAHAYQVLADPAGDAHDFSDIALSPDGQILAAATDQGILLWELATGRKLEMIDSATIRSVCFDQTSGLLLASDGQGFRQWQLVRQDNLHGMIKAIEMESPSSRLENLGKMALARDGSIAAVIKQNVVELIHPQAPDQISTLEANTLYETLALSPDGRLLAARPARSQDIHLWDTQQKVRIQTPMPLHGGPEFSFSPDGRWFCASTVDGFAVWAVQGWTPERIIPCQRPAIQPGLMAFSDQTGLLAVALGPSLVGVVRLPQGDILVRLENPDRQPLAALAFSHDGLTLAMAAREQVAMVWDLGEVTARLGELNLAGDLPVALMPNGVEDYSVKKALTKIPVAIGP